MLGLSKMKFKRIMIHMLKILMEKAGNMKGQTGNFSKVMKPSRKKKSKVKKKETVGLTIHIDAAKKVSVSLKMVFIDQVTKN